MTSLPAALRRLLGLGGRAAGGAGGVRAGHLVAGPGAVGPPGTFYQLTSRSGVAPILWMDRSAPSYSSSGVRRRAVTDLIRP